MFLQGLNVLNVNYLDKLNNIISKVQTGENKNWSRDTIELKAEQIIYNTEQEEKV